MSKLRIGIFALQGDFDLHAQKLRDIGFTPSFVRLPEDLQGLDGLVIPGGESGAYLKLIKPIKMDHAIRSFAQTKGLFTTCAGTITIARKVTNPEQNSLNLLDIFVERNAYGRQLDSIDTVSKSKSNKLPDSIPMTFIRAPKITYVGESITVLATYNEDPVLVRDKKIVACTFHPELAEGTSIYEYWLQLLA